MLTGARRGVRALRITGQGQLLDRLASISLSRDEDVRMTVAEIRHKPN